ncbi:DUF1028 domain-containing protein [Acuticoccus mangrovi]|uniref:DUF1028 domain-containing protein n=1 Tax=Acuticoccus mangrovi TaxID=2796142 RepID=A0A934MHV0_9HYPH|nr:DUF1028 domain-containing protein [Acuticoccus mangrovi]MBJ3776486.1 DUF1028 domain-containing protein [Acuticoccus mangrovi]
MTWSIVARDDATGAYGVAVTSCFFAVGALVPHVRAGVGAVATQALVNAALGQAALDSLAAGRSAVDTVAALLEGDEGRDVRQLHLVGATGSAGHTGARCPAWAGRAEAASVSVAGNTLAGSGVVQATLAAYWASPAPFAERLVAALSAGEIAGGDVRGRQSAALVVRGVPGAPDVDIRVDDHAEPIVELARLLAVHHGDFVPIARLLPGFAGTSGVFDPQSVAAARDERQTNRDAGRTPSLGTLRPAPVPERPDR